MVFYSRMYIQESLFACFTLAFVIAVGRVATGGGLAWSVLAGVAAGLAVATKETSVIVLPAALVGCAIAWWSLGPDRPVAARRTGDGGARSSSAWRRPRRSRALFYSSFLADPAGVLEPFRAAGTYLDRGVDPASPRAAVALLPRPARLLVVRRPDVERGAGARAGAVGA